MIHLRGAAIGVGVFLGVVVAVVVLMVYLGYAPMMADSAPSALEANLAMSAVHAISAREMGARKNPLPLTAENLSAGLETYTKNCIMCHGAADGKPSAIAAGFYIPAPQFAADGTEDDPEGATFWKIHHGIRFSAMPAFMSALSDAQIWRVTMFLKHMNELPAAVAARWKAVASVGSGSAMPNMDMR